MNSYTLYKLDKEIKKLKNAVLDYDPKAVAFNKEMLAHRVVGACKDCLEALGYNVTEQITDPDVFSKKTLLKYYYARVQNTTNIPIIVDHAKDNKVLANLILDVGNIFLLADEKAIIAKIKCIVDKLIHMVSKEALPLQIEQLVSFNRVFYRNKTKDGVNFIINLVIVELIKDGKEDHISQLQSDSDKLEEEYFATHGGMFGTES